MTSTTPDIRCLEFFSGIGGLHYAFNQTGIQGSVLASWDVNLNANRVYSHNFAKEPSTTEIQRLSLRDIEKHEANCWLMSPPCQPHTRGGKRLDDKDPRSEGFLHLIDEILPKMKVPPTYIFVENVLNFEMSATRDRMLDRLRSLSYTVKECLLSPMQFGIPNNRERYYCMARRDVPFSAPPDSPPVIHTEWPFPGMEINVQDDTEDVPSLKDYLGPLIPENVYEWIVPDKWIMMSKDFRFDIVKPNHKRTATFTKAYGTKHGVFAGSLMQTESMEFSDYDFANPESILPLKLRLFTPLEVAHLHAFPLRPNTVVHNHDIDHVVATSEKVENGTTTDGIFRARGPPYLEFPNEVTTKQQFSMLGNSLNVWVVSRLMRLVLFEGSSSKE